MAKYVVLDEKGFPKAFYDSKINNYIPCNAILISEEVWKTLIENQGKVVYFKNEIINIENKIWDEQNKIWRDKTEEELLEEERYKKLIELDILTTNYILKNYSDVKQKSDLADKEYFGAALLMANPNYTTDEIYRKVGEYANQLLDNFYKEIQEGTEHCPAIILTKFLDEILQKLPESERFYWEQLIKVGVRTAWVQLVKDKYRKLKEQILNISTLDELKSVNITEADFPLFPKFQ